MEVKYYIVCAMNVYTAVLHISHESKSMMICYLELPLCVGCIP